MKFSFYKYIMICAVALSFAGVALAQSEREKGFEHYKRGEYEKAVEILQKAVEEDDKNQESWLYLGMAFSKLKKSREAGKAFRKADKLPLKELAENEKALVIISKPKPQYTDLARMNQTQGTIAFAIEFGADGVSKNAFIFQSLPSGLTEKAIEAAEKIKFKPAIRDGKPVSTIKIVKYSFAIY